MKARLRILGFALAVVGIAFAAAGTVAYAKARDGYQSLQAFSAEQNVTLSYDDDGQLTDRGEVEGAQAIMGLLTDDWAYPAVASDFDPADPLVNTASEYMYQMAAIAYHTLNGTQTVTLDEAVDYDGQTFAPGTYEFAVDGRYWTGFDRSHPIEGPAREQAWSGTAHGLIAELGVGALTHSALQLGLALAGAFAGIGATLILTGAGMVWVARGEFELGFDKLREPVSSSQRQPAKA